MNAYHKINRLVKAAIAPNRLAIVDSSADIAGGRYKIIRDKDGVLQLLGDGKRDPNKAMVVSEDELLDMVRKAKASKKTIGEVKSAQSFSKDQKTFRIPSGKTVSHVVNAWNKSHPWQKIDTKGVVSANGGLAPEKFRADRDYKMPALAPAVVRTPDSIYWDEHDSYVTANGSTNAIPGLVNRRTDVRKMFGPQIPDPTSTNGTSYATRLNNAISKIKPVIRKWEKFVPEAYQDPLDEGLWTIGYGHTYIKDPKTGKIRDVMPGDKMNGEQAEQYLNDTLRELAKTLNKNNPWWKYLGENAMAGGLDTSFNLGPYALDRYRSPRLTAAMNAWLDTLKAQDVQKVRR